MTTTAGQAECAGRHGISISVKMTVFGYQTAQIITAGRNAVVSARQVLCDSIPGVAADR